MNNLNGMSPEDFYASKTVEKKTNLNWLVVCLISVSASVVTGLITYSYVKSKYSNGMLKKDVE